MKVPVCGLYLTDIEELVHSPELFGKIMKKLPSGIRERLTGREDSRAACLSCAAWYLLAEALEEAGIDASREDVAYGKAGKPFLKDRPELHFSLSHSGTRAICLIGPVPCGCDIQLIRGGWEGISRRFLAEEERAALDAAPAHAKEALFHRIWARKESLLKASGKGLTQDPGSFSVCENGAFPEFVRAEGECGYYFRETEIISGYALSCCYQWKQEAELTELKRPDAELLRFRRID